jgi:hypothetical protein
MWYWYYNGMMDLDKDLYRQGYKSFREYNEAELRERIRNSDQRPPEQAWRQFVALWEFGRQMKLKQSPKQREQKLAALARYYDRVQKLEAWRAAGGRKP